jgi:hypothetical protein
MLLTRSLQTANSESLLREREEHRIWAFRVIPDVLIRRLDLVLPEGKTSILAASSGLCTNKPLKITTAITAQNGAKLKPGVTVSVSGCKKPKRHKQTRHAKQRHGK